MEGKFFAVAIVVGLPIGFVLLASAFFGMVLLRSLPVAMPALGTMPSAKVTHIALMIIPLFILVGAFATQAGVSEQAFQIEEWKELPEYDALKAEWIKSRQARTDVNVADFLKVYQETPQKNLPKSTYEQKFP